jgi:hypothetical protein
MLLLLLTPSPPLSSCLSFRHSMVVTTGVKLLAWLVVLLINFFFVFFSLLRGLERGAHWQRLFLMACIFRESFYFSFSCFFLLTPSAEILVEIVVYETTECVIVHYVIPSTSPLLLPPMSFTSHSCHRCPVMLQIWQGMRWREQPSQSRQRF